MSKTKEGPRAPTLDEVLATYRPALKLAHRLLNQPDASPLMPEGWQALLHPLAKWPADLLRAHGTVILLHPIVASAVGRLSLYARSPVAAGNPTRPNSTKWVPDTIVLERGTGGRIAERFEAGTAETRRGPYLVKSLTRKAGRVTVELQGERTKRLGLDEIQKLSPEARDWWLRKPRSRRQTYEEARAQLVRLSTELLRLSRGLTKGKTSGRRKEWANRNAAISVEYDRLLTEEKIPPPGARAAAARKFGVNVGSVRTYIRRGDEIRGISRRGLKRKPRQ